MTNGRSVVDLTMRIRNLLISLVIGTFATFAGAQVATSNFDLNSDGWSINDLSSSFFGNPPTVLNTWPIQYASSGGNPGGRVWTADVSGGPITCFSAPLHFLGDKDSAYGGSFTFDMRISAANVTNRPGLILVGGGLTLYRPMSVTGSGWNRYSVPLTEEGWQLNSESGPTPTAFQMHLVLSNLSALYVSGEWDWVNTNEVTDFDNPTIETSGGPVVTLNVKLAGWASSTLPAVYVTIDGVNGRQYLLQPVNAVVGTTQITLPAEGIHRVRVKPSTCLAQAIMVDSAQGVQTVNFHGPLGTGLLPGDVNDDNVIDIADYASLSFGYGTEGDSE